MEQFLAILNEPSATALAGPSTAALIGGGAALVLVLLMMLVQSGGLRRLRKALEAEQQSRVKLHEAVDSSGKKLEALRNEVGQYQGRIAQLESDKQNQAGRIDALSDELNAQQNLNSQLEQRLTQADALLKEQTTQINSQLTQYQALLDSARQANDARIAELGRQMEQLQQRLAALQEPIQFPPPPFAAAEATPALEAELEQHKAPLANLGEQPASVESPVSQPSAAPASTAATAPSPQELPAMEPEVPVAEQTAPVTEPATPAVTSPAQAEPEPAKAKADKGLFGMFGKKAAAPEQPQASQEKTVASAAVAEPEPVKAGAKKGVLGLFGKKTAAPAEPPAKQEKPVALPAAPQPTPAPEQAKEAPPVQAEAKPGLFGGQSAPVQPEAPAPACAPEAGEPEKETVTKALLSFMSDDLKKGTNQLKGLFKFGGKK